MMPLSTGTNNVFPVLAEATVAGSTLGLIGSGKLDAKRVSYPLRRLSTLK